MNTQITFEKIVTGTFLVLRNGERTGYQILNGSLGLSGRNTQNTYGIKNTENGKVRWIGTLAAAKKTATFWLTRG